MRHSGFPAASPSPRHDGIGAEPDAERGEPMNHWTAPPELTASTPRKVRLSGAYQSLITLVVIVVMLPALAVIADSGFALYTKASLRARGVITDGTVVNLYVTRHKARDQYHLKYRYELLDNPAHESRPFDKYAFVSSDEYRSMTVGDKVRVIYDPLDPDRAIPNIGKSGANMPLLRPSLLLTLVGLALLVVLVASSVTLALLQYIRERRLLRWGRAAPATILDQRRRYGQMPRWPAVSFEFMDDVGRTIGGTQTYIPRRWDLRLRFVKYRPSIFSNPTVLFDPGASDHNLLYPTILAELA